MQRMRPPRWKRWIRCAEFVSVPARGRRDCRNREKPCSSVQENGDLIAHWIWLGISKAPLTSMVLQLGNLVGL